MNKFKWDARDYANHSKSQQIWGRELIKKLKLNGKERVLDIGCGDGKITAEIAKAVSDGDVIGIDNSEEMIRLANHTYPATEHPNLKFELLDAQKLDYCDKFDVAFSNAVLHWIKDHTSLLQKIFRSLKPGGRALLQMGGSGNASEIIDVLSVLIKNDPWQVYFTDFESPYYFYSPKDYTPWVSQTGFTKSRMELLPKAMIHKNRSELQGWIRTTWHPYLNPVPKKLHKKFIKEIAENYLKLYPKTAQGTINVKMVRLEVDLVKPNIY
jgi:trans-aconitate methyltransferase